MSMMMPEGFGPPPMPENGGGSPTDLLRTGLDAIQQYMQSEEDDTFSKEAAKAAQILYGILSTLQKEGEAAGGIGPQHKFVARQNSGGGGGY